MDEAYDRKLTNRSCLVQQPYSLILCSGDLILILVLFFLVIAREWTSRRRLMHDHIVQASFLNVDAWTMKD